MGDAHLHLLAIGRLSEAMVAKHSVRALSIPEQEKLLLQLKKFDINRAIDRVRLNQPANARLLKEMKALHNLLRSLSLYADGEGNPLKLAARYQLERSAIFDEIGDFVSTWGWFNKATQLESVMPEAIERVEKRDLDDFAEVGFFDKKGAEFDTKLKGILLPAIFRTLYPETEFGKRKSVDGERLYEGAGYTFVHFCMTEILGCEGVTFDSIANAKPSV